MLTPSERLIRRNNNMDAIRYVLMLFVFLSHYDVLCEYFLPAFGLGYWRVSCFFALSGFLLFRTYEKNSSFKSFVVRRARRLLPPYMLVVILCAVFMVFVSDCPASEYYFSAHWWKYTICNLLFLNFLEPSLPGVFTGSGFEIDAVNGALWTMKIEWCLSLTVPLFEWLMRRFRGGLRARNIISLSIVLVSVGYTLLFDHLYYATEQEIYNILGRQIFGQLSFFYVGALIYFNFERFLRYKFLIFGCILGLIAAGTLSHELSLGLMPFTAAGLVLFFSFTGRWGHYFSRHDNVSYDMYLFHYPLIQLGVYFGVRDLPAGVGFAIVFGVTVLMALASWNLVGKHFIPSRHPKSVKNR